MSELDDVRARDAEIHREISALTAEHKQVERRLAELGHYRVVLVTEPRLMRSTCALHIADNCLSGERPGDRWWALAGDGYPQWVCDNCAARCPVENRQ